MTALAKQSRSQTQIQLAPISESNFAQFTELLRYREWREGKAVPEQLPHARAQQMAQLTQDPASGCFIWLIQNQKTLEAVGAITIMPVFHIGCRQLGYWVLPEHHNQGYATLAVKAVTQLCFEQMNVARMQAQALPDNPASIRVLEKAEYTREAELPASDQVDGKAVTAILYGKVNKQENE